jgi:hypothetical protein
LKYLKILDERKADIPSLQLIVEKGLHAYDGQVEIEVPEEDV